MEDLGAEVVRIRKQLGLSQAEFAAGMGVSQATVCRWEKGINLHERTLFAARYMRDQRLASKPDAA